MSSPRHRAVSARPSARTWFRKHLGPAVVSTSLTAMAVTVGVAGVEMGDDTQDMASAVRGGAGTALGGDLAAFEARGDRASRTAKRVTLEPRAVDRKWATADLNVWTGPGERFKRVGLIQSGSKLAVTGQVRGGWAEILLQDGKKEQVRWVNNDYLADKKPVVEKPEPEDETATTTTAARSTGLSSAPCRLGSSIESGLTSNGDAVYRAVCAAFPSVTSYGGLRPGDSGAHGSGRGLDIMISGSAGWAIAEYVRANAGALGVSEVIYSQKIWTVQRSGEGWRYMSDRGSVTANHYDHVHVTVY